MSANAIPQPVEIRRMSPGDFPPHGGLRIEWSDGLQQESSSETLRRNCPCATCQEQRGESSHEKPLTQKSSLLKVVKASAEESLLMEQIWSVGNYAIGLRWGDGHDSGIYSFELLRQLQNPSDAKHES